MSWGFQVKLWVYSEGIDLTVPQGALLQSRYRSYSHGARFYKVKISILQPRRALLQLRYRAYNPTERASTVRYRSYSHRMRFYRVKISILQGALLQLSYWSYLTAPQRPTLRSAATGWLIVACQREGSLKGSVLAGCRLGRTGSWRVDNNPHQPRLV